MISVICATRKRPKYLERMCLSLFDNATDKNGFEVLLGIDNDDFSSLNEFLGYEISRKISLTIVCFQRMGYSKMNEYLNQLAKKASGEWLFIMGDDAFVNTDGWDAKLNAINDRLICNTKNPSDPAYSAKSLMHFAIHKKWIEATGRISPYQQSDTYLTAVAKRAGLWNPDWLFEVCHVDEKSSPSQRIDDEVTREIVYANNLPHDEIEKDIKNLKAIHPC